MALIVLDGFLCPMLDATMRGFMEEMDAVDMFD